MLRPTHAEILKITFEILEIHTPEDIIQKQHNVDVQREILYFKT